jgi:hypothetical protein
LIKEIQQSIDALESKKDNIINELSLIKKIEDTFKQTG